MATRWYLKGLEECLKGVIDLDGDTLKLMLVNANYTFDPDHLVVDNSGDDATDPSFNELVATGYVKGYNGAGRKTATVTVASNTTDDRVEVSLADVTWSSIGGAVNGTIAAALLIKEGANDADSRLIAHFDITDIPTNGGNITLDFAATGGQLRMSV